MTEQPPSWISPDPVGPPAQSGSSHSGSFYPGAVGAARPLGGVVPLRPLGLGELLDGAVGVIRRCPGPVLSASAVVSVVGGGLHLLVALSVLGPLADASASVSTGSSDALTGLLGAAAVATGLNLLVSIVTGALLTGVVTAVVGRAVFGDRTSVRTAWNTLRPRLLSLLLVSLLAAAGTWGPLVVTIGLVALLATASGLAAGLSAVVLIPLGCVLAVLLYIRWSLAPAVTVLEKQPVVTSLRRSSVLVARSFWRVLGILLLAGLIATFVSFVLVLPFQLFGLSSLSNLGRGAANLSASTLVLSAVASALIATLVAPFTAAVRALLYVDRRMRAEGLDVALVAELASRSTIT